MFTSRPFSIISILLLLFASFQLTWTIRFRDNEDIYPQTSSGNDNDGSGNVHARLDKNVNVNSSNSTNEDSDGKHIYEQSHRPWTISPSKMVQPVPEEITPIQKIGTTNPYLPSSEIYRYLLFINPRYQWFDIDDNSENVIKRKINTSLPVHLNESDGKSSNQLSTEFHTRSLPEARCSWQGHCDGARCKNENDCSDDRICIQRRCGRPTRRHEKPCSWKGHCDGAQCRNENDCSDDRICIQGRCGSLDQQPDTNTNANTNTNPSSIPSQQTSIGGNGGNGYVIINISGGNGGSGGSSYVVPRQ